MSYREKIRRNLGTVDDQLRTTEANTNPFSGGNTPLGVFASRGMVPSGPSGQQAVGRVTRQVCMANLLLTPVGNRASRGEKSPERNIQGRWKLPVTTESPPMSKQFLLFPCVTANHYCWCSSDFNLWESSKELKSKQGTSCYPGMQQIRMNTCLMWLLQKI